ncbi:MAG: Crp/Fnr family transcriptional regulator [Actinomycetota bacterium]
MAKDQKIALLKDVPLFWGCSDKELKTIAGIADQVECPEGRVIMKEGSAGQELWVIAKGNVKISRNGRKVRSVGPGAAIGELSLLDGGERSATITTETPVTAYVIGQRNFTSLLHDAPSVAVKIMRGMASRLRTAEKTSAAN